MTFLAKSLKISGEWGPDPSTTVLQPTVNAKGHRSWKLLEPPLSFFPRSCSWNFLRAFYIRFMRHEGSLSLHVIRIRRTDRSILDNDRLSIVYNVLFLLLYSRNAVEADSGRTVEHVDEPPEEHGCRRAGQHEFHAVRHQQTDAFRLQRQQLLNHYYHKYLLFTTTITITRMFRLVVLLLL